MAEGKVSLPAPYYQDDAVTLYHCDNAEIIPFVKADLCLSDPPYGVNFDTDYRRFSNKGKGCTKLGTNYRPIIGDKEPFDPDPLITRFKDCILWGANCYSQRLPLGAWLIWDKRYDSGAAWLADAEAAWMSKGFGVYIYSLCALGGLFPDGKRVHPTQKPVALMKWCISRFPKTKSVFDPYCGSGSTLVAAKQMGLTAIGVELEERYCEIGAKRLSQEELFK